MVVIDVPFPIYFAFDLDLFGITDCQKPMRNFKLSIPLYLVVRARAQQNIFDVEVSWICYKQNVTEHPFGFTSSQFLFPLLWKIELQKTMANDNI